MARKNRGPVLFLCLALCAQVLEAAVEHPPKTAPHPLHKINDTSMLRGWTQMFPSGPAPTARAYHTTVSDNKGRLFMFGGNTAVFSLDLQNDLHALHLDGSGKWEKLDPWGTPPLPRYRHTAIFDEASRSMIVFGGATAPNLYDPPIILNDVCHYHVDKNEWQSDVETTGAKPPARVYHVAVVREGVMTIFGGNGASQFFNDVYSYHIAQRRWDQIDASGDKPVARSHASAVLFQNKMILFGGLRWHGPEGYLNDIYTLDLDTHRWTKINAEGFLPSRRVGHTAIILQTSMYIFGGYEIDGLFVNDLYQFNIDTNTWREVATGTPAPRPRFSHTAAVPPGAASTFLILYGYSDELVLPATNLDDIWYWQN